MNETVNLNHAPSYSFGQKTGQEKINDTPGMINNSVFIFFYLKKQLFYFVTSSMCIHARKRSLRSHSIIRLSQVRNNSTPGLHQVRMIAKICFLYIFLFCQILFILFLCFMFHLFLCVWLFSGRPIIA